jgi:hypothetical protein
VYGQSHGHSRAGRSDDLDREPQLSRADGHARHGDLSRESGGRRRERGRGRDRGSARGVMCKFRLSLKASVVD